MAGMLTTIGIFALFLLLVVLPVVKRQKKYETKYGIKANECKFSERQGYLSETMPEIYDPSYSGLPGNAYYRKR